VKDRSGTFRQGSETAGRGKGKSAPSVVESTAVGSQPREAGAMGGIRVLVVARIRLFREGLAQILDRRSRPRVPIPTPPGPLRAPPETSSPTSPPERATRPQRLAALRPGAPAPPLIASADGVGTTPRGHTCPSRSPAFFLSPETGPIQIVEWRQWDVECG